MQPSRIMQPITIGAVGSAVLIVATVVASACGGSSSSPSQSAGGSGATSGVSSGRTGLSDGGGAAGGSSVEDDGASGASIDGAESVEEDGASSTFVDGTIIVPGGGGFNGAEGGPVNPGASGREDAAPTGGGPANPDASGIDDAALRGVDSGTGDTGGRNAGGDAAPPTAFTCNLLIGNSTTQQWFDGGFLTYPGIDPMHWELYWVAHHYIDLWANPDDSAWTTPLDMGHACAAASATPDRVIFIVTYAPPYPTESTYLTDTTSVVDNIIAKYPTVKRIELMTLIRSPGNDSAACSSQPNNEQSIPTDEDQALEAVAAAPAFVGLVFALPPFYVPSCSDFVINAPQYTTAGATDIANVYGAYYATHP